MSLLRVTMLATVTLVAVVGFSTPASAATITSSGPLTRIEITPDLNCAVNHASDTEPEFYGGTACATLIATGGTLYGPADIPAGGNASPRTTYTAVSQITTGTGSSADPYTIVTVVDAGASGLRLTQTDSYVVGQESYRTDVRVTNTSESAVIAVVYKAGDCYLQNSDLGFGAYDSATGAISCVAGESDASGTVVPGLRIEQFFPLTAGSSYLEHLFAEVWTAVGSQQPLPNQCAACDNYVDNGIALSWSLNLAAGASATVSHFTTFSPLGVVPLSTTKTADSANSAPGTANGYTITVTNPNASPVTLDSITDTLPSGFTYTIGSSTGATTSNPTVNGQELTWAGPLSVPANGSLSLHFAVTVSSTPGQYFNDAGATSGSVAVAPSGPSAAITVSAPSQSPPVAADQTVVVPQDTATPIKLAASDPDGDPLTFTVASQPTNGTLSGSGPDLTYTPTAGFIGTDSFTFTASDGLNTSNVATVTVHVAPAPAIPLMSVESLPLTAGAVALLGAVYWRRRRRPA